MTENTTKVFLPGAELDKDETAIPMGLGPLDGLQDILKVEPVGATNVAAARSASTRAEPKGFEAKPDDILEIQLENGLRVWQTVESAESDYAQVSRSAQDLSLLVPHSLPLRDPSRPTSRGLRDYAVKGVSILRGTFTKKVGEKAGETTAHKVAHMIESKLQLGLHKLSRPAGDIAATPGTGPAARPSSGFALTPVDAKDIPTDKPILVLLHGTFSSINGSYSHLLERQNQPGHAPLWDRLETVFTGGIYGFEHRSVTDSPMRNAIDLVKALPEGANLSMLSYSRGGLIAELVARSARFDLDEDGEIDPEALKSKTYAESFDDRDTEIMRDAGASDAQLKEKSELKGWLTRRKLKIDRIVRVAGPVGGTTLASNRLDRFLSVTLNAFDLIPVLRASVAYDLFQSFMVGLVKTKADPTKLPGLEAMRPLGPTVRMLNRGDIALDSKLVNIAGDFEGAGMLRKLAEMAADFFFEDENDFVVNTPSMSRGMPRLEPASTVDIVGETVTHFTYFTDATARMSIMSALLPEAGFFPLAAPLSHREVVEEPVEFIDLSARDDTSQPVCFVLPGVMGSHIYQDDKWVWTNPIRLATGGVRRLRVDADDVEPGPMLNMFYGDLARFVGRSHKAIAFSYDWRMSIEDTADILAERVREELEVADRPIRFLAHSMGGLVVRAFQHKHKDLWQRIKARGNTRFVMLGTPNGGAASMIDNMLGRTRQMKLIEAADIRHSMPELLSVITALPGLAQLLPSDQNGHYLKSTFWEQLHAHDGKNWVIPPDTALAAARDGHKLLRDHVLDPETTCYVAGLGEAATPSLVHLVDDGKGGRQIEVRGTFEGDGTVTWKTGIPDGIATWYMSAIHGDLARTESAFPALLDLLDTGATQGLPQRPPALARGAPAGEVVIPEPEVETFPNAGDIAAAALGASVHPVDPLDSATPRVKVSVAHGDLRFAKYPVAVGHYLGDPISGAEAALDACLDRHLSHVRDLGLYPGDLETCEIMLRKKHSPQGALVVGLGTFGDLTPGKLRDTFRQAVLRYTMTVRRRHEESGGSLANMPPVGVSTLVIGNRGADITIHQSVEALLEAVVDANKVLKDTPIAHLQFIELFDDTAYATADALERISQNGRSKHSFTHDRSVNSLDGARLRADFGASGDTWQRMKITADRDIPMRLNFEAVSNGAKVPIKFANMQPELRAELVARSGKDTAEDRELGRMLFELMIPNELKSFAKDDQKLLVIVDETTAQYPWELVEDDYSAFEAGGANARPVADIKPLVVRTPVIRQLVTGGNVAPRASRHSALVIGDPVTRDMAELPAAAGEAVAVSDKLIAYCKDRLPDGDPDTAPQVEAMIRPKDGFAVLERLICQQNKILHLAAHGVLGDDAAGTAPGMVLGDGLKLTAYEVRQMRYVPELVFLNCCHLGKISPGDVGKIASNLAHVFIQQGARAVVAAGWAVDDAAAACFADKFYSSMLAGSSFGDAVHHARLETYTHHAHTNTWGAYQCYGDPEYRLKLDDQSTTTRRSQARYYSAEHATKAAINIGNDASTSTQSKATLVANLSAIEENARPGWRDNAEWCEAMARAYANLNVFDRAIPLMQRAISLPTGLARIGSLETLENLKVRASFAKWEAATTKEDRDKAARDVSITVSHTLDLLSKLDDLTSASDLPENRSSDREGLKGSALKRRAMVETGKARELYLREMISAYKQGMDLAETKTPGQLHIQCALNWVIGHLVLGERAAEGVPLDVWLERLRESGRQAEALTPSFWNVAQEAELEIMLPLLGERDAPIDPLIDMTAQYDSVQDYLKAAWARGGSYKQARSIREQLTFLSRMMDTAHRDKKAWVERVARLVVDVTSSR